jgi:hypothetical protein
MLDSTLTTPPEARQRLTVEQLDNLRYAAAEMQRRAACEIVRWGKLKASPGLAGLVIDELVKFRGKRKALAARAKATRWPDLRVVGGEELK